jgi:hypothetical protein
MVVFAIKRRWPIVSGPGTGKHIGQSSFPPEASRYEIRPHPIDDRLEFYLWGLLCSGKKFVVLLPMSFECALLGSFIGWYDSLLILDE